MFVYAALLSFDPALSFSFFDYGNEEKKKTFKKILTRYPINPGWGYTTIGCDARELQEIYVILKQS